MQQGGWNQGGQQQGGYPPPGGHGQMQGGAPPPGAPPGMGMPQAPQMPTADESKSFFAGLFDFSFTNLVAPKVIKVLYIIFLVVLALGTLAGLGMAAITLIQGEIIAAIFSVIILPFAVVLYLIFGRIYFELIILAFRMLECLDTIAKNTAK